VVRIAPRALIAASPGTDTSDAAQLFDAELARHSRALKAGDYAGALAITTRVGAAQPALHPQLRLRVLDALYSTGDRAAALAAVDDLQRAVDGNASPATAADSAIRLADLCVLAQ
jgi:hypothetical protein